MTAKNAPGSAPDAWKDPDDAPQLTEAFFDGAEIRHGDKVLRPGRPATGRAKQLVTLRLDPEVLARLRASGPGWQTRAAASIRQMVMPKTVRVQTGKSVPPNR